MTDAPTQATDYTVDDFIKEISNADRVVVETKNALGEMDAHYMPASVVLKALNTRTDQHLALLAAAYEAGAEKAFAELDAAFRPQLGSWVQSKIRALTPDDAVAMLERVKREARNEALREAAEAAKNTATCLLSSGHFLSERCSDAILALMEDTGDE